jgi:hypothetical protein
LSVFESSRKMTVREQTAYDLGFHEGRNAAVIHGRWEKSEYNGFLRCDQCKDVYIPKEWLTDGKWSYCPNCCAKLGYEGKVVEIDQFNKMDGDSK